MNNIINRFIKSSILSAISLIVLALLLILQSELTIIVISYVIGALLIALGVQAELQFVKNINNSSFNLNLIYGIVCVILGIIVISNPTTIAEIVPLVIGFIMVVTGALKIQYSIELKRLKSKLWLATLILSIIMSVCGVVLIINPFQGALFLTRIVGVLVLIYAVLDLISSIFIKRTLKKSKKKETEIKEAVVVEEKEDNKEDKD